MPLWQLDHPATEKFGKVEYILIGWVGAVPPLKQKIIYAYHRGFELRNGPLLLLSSFVERATELLYFLCGCV